MALQYRVASRDDLDALAAFWNAHGGWDTLDAEGWAERFMTLPNGLETRIVVGEDDGEIVSQFLFVPTLVWTGEATVRALRPFAPIVAPGVRGGLSPLQHPVVAMFRYAYAAFQDVGESVVYMIPDPRWRRLFKALPQFRTAPFPLLSRPLPFDAPLALDGHTASPLDGWGPEVDALWEASRDLVGVQVVRDRQTLPWKVGGGDYTLTAVRRGGDLVGLAASRHKGDRQWLVCDVLAADEAALRAALAAAANEGHAAATATPDAIDKVSVLGAPLVERAALALGFARERYTFHLVVARLGDGVPEAIADPARWTVSPND